MPPNAARRPSVGLVILALLAVVVVFERVHTDDEPLERGVAGYAVIGHEMLRGWHLHADLSERKPPLLYATFAAAYAAAYAAGGPAAAALWAGLGGSLFLQANQPDAQAFVNACLNACLNAGIAAPVRWPPAVGPGADRRRPVRRRHVVQAPRRCPPLALARRQLRPGRPLPDCIAYLLLARPTCCWPAAAATSPGGSPATPGDWSRSRRLWAGRPPIKLRGVPPFLDTPAAPVSAPPADPSVPRWGNHLPGTRLTTVRIPNASARPAADLSAAVAAAYADVLATALPHPVRFWNFLPDINGPLDGHQSRYMAFNAGRLAAFAARPDARVATASAVGHGGRDLWVHCLSADRPGTAVDNPRQVQPHRYSARYGRRPPCFARACRLGRHLFVGGTASVVGEASVHDDLDAQAAETLANLSAVLAAAGPAFTLTDVRAYHLPTVDAGHLRHLLPPSWQLECVPAEMCRPELLVEIEAIGELTGEATT